MHSSPQKRVVSIRETVCSNNFQKSFAYSAGSPCSESLQCPKLPWIPRAYPATAIIWVGSLLTLVFGVLNLIVAVAWAPRPKGSEASNFLYTLTVDARQPFWRCVDEVCPISEWQHNTIWNTRLGLCVHTTIVETLFWTCFLTSNSSPCKRLSHVLVWHLLLSNDVFPISLLFDWNSLTSSPHQKKTPRQKFGCIASLGVSTSWTLSGLAGTLMIVSSGGISMTNTVLFSHTHQNHEKS